MGVRVYREQRTPFYRGMCHRVGQIEPVRLSIHLQRYASFDGRLNDSLEVELDRLTAADQPRRGMADDVDIRIGYRVERSPGHAIFALAERSVQRSDNHFEAREHLVRIIELAVRQDIYLGSEQDARLASFTLLAHRLELLDLLFQPVEI
jgi:hypothetical protein